MDGAFRKTWAEIEKKNDAKAVCRRCSSLCVR